MNILPILLCGAGGHARACIDVIEREAQYFVAGLVGREEEVGTKVLGYDVIGTDAQLEDWVVRIPHALVAVGQIKSCATRMRAFLRLEECGYRLPTIVSPGAHVSRHATVGEGTIVMHGAVVNAGALVGRNCIINSHALVEHDASVADHCHIATSAVLNSGVRVGLGTFVGSNSAVRQLVSIGKNCIIGMGQRVVKDLADGAQIPAKVVS
jgi:sugar O-acyltransferase (sialic acid O-acetyltransferase NeuD family)